MLLYHLNKMLHSQAAAPPQNRQARGPWHTGRAAERYRGRPRTAPRELRAQVPPAGRFVSCAAASRGGRLPMEPQSAPASPLASPRASLCRCQAGRRRSIFSPRGRPRGRRVGWGEVSWRERAAVGLQGVRAGTLL